MDALELKAMDDGLQVIITSFWWPHKFTALVYKKMTLKY